jgi:UDP-N-acetylmuramoyl-tripeptide--D-alanyl-D-alanine ligase
VGHAFVEGSFARRLVSGLKSRVRRLVKPFRRQLRRLYGTEQALAGWRKRLQSPRAQLRRLMRPDITYVGVTGSCGKTTTTRLIGAVLSQVGEVRTDAGRNGPSRVLENILAIGAKTKFCVQELSGSRPDRIRLQVKSLRPQIGVITTIGSDHYKNFRSLEATAQEKSRLVAFLPRRGTAILNADDPHVIAMRDRTRARVITYGVSREADIRAEDVRSAWPDRLSLTVLHGQERLRVQTQLVGEFWITSVLAAIACGLTQGLDLKTCAAAITKFEPVFGRASVHSVPGGPDFIIETQKAPLWTIANTMTIMRNARATRKTMVIGTVSDYSGKGGDTHRKVARLALDVADRVVFVGPQAGHVSKLRQGEVKERLFAFVTSYQASEFLAETAIAGELIHVKASITDHLERIMLSQFDSVTCWRERCGVENSCPDCCDYRTSCPPPFGLDAAESESATGEQSASSEAAPSL